MTQKLEYEFYQFDGSINELVEFVIQARDCGKRQQDDD